MSVGAAPTPYHLLPSPSQRLFCPWRGQSLMLVLWKHGALWICPILSPSFLAMQSRIACVRTRAHTHTHTHTHRQVHKTCLITSICCLSSFLAGWASTPKFQALVCIS